MHALSLDYDSRIRSHALLGRTTYGWYLAATRGSESNLKIQRDIIRSRKAYETLRADIRRGCLLPPIVLAFHSDDLPELPGAQLTGNDYSEMLERVGRIVQAASPSQIQIIDGLQRTNALREAEQDLLGVDMPTFVEHPLRVEVWLNIPFLALAYRMLLLNAGQRPMSMKHQIEILADNLVTELSGIRGLEVIKSMEHRRRVRPGQFHLVRLSEVFQAWLQGQPNIELRNVIAEQVLADDAVDALGSGLASSKVGADQDEFRAFVQWLVDVDIALGPDRFSIFHNETVLQGLAAAYGDAQRNPELRPRLDRAALALLHGINSDPDSDPMGVTAFNQLRAGIDPKKRNIGEATRELVFRAFRDFFYAGGETPMARCWTVAASAI